MGLKECSNSSSKDINNNNNNNNNSKTASKSQKILNFLEIEFKIKWEY